MERVASCVYENHVIPPVRQEHKSQYILSTGIRFFCIHFSSKHTVTVVGAWISSCDGKGLVKEQCQIQEALSEVQYFK
jgi:hypothetical protein